MARTYLVHTEPANKETVLNYVGDQKERHGEPDAIIELCSADSAGNIGDADPKQFEAVVSSGLPKHQEIIAAYKEIGVRVTNISTVDPDFAKKQKAAAAEVEAKSKKK